MVNHLVDSWNLNRAIWERHSELVNVEETPNSASHAYKVVFYPVCKAKRYIQVCEKYFHIPCKAIKSGIIFLIDQVQDHHHSKFNPGKTVTVYKSLFKKQLLRNRINVQQMDRMTGWFIKSQHMGNEFCK